MENAKPTSYLEVALLVLRAGHRPMTTRQIIDEATDSGLLSPKGETPKRTMDARLYEHVKKNPNSKLVRMAKPGSVRAVRSSVRWALREWSIGE